MNRMYIQVILALLLTSRPGLAQNSASDFADLVMINGRIWTGADQSTFVEAVAVRGNTITQVGTSEDIRRLADRYTTVIDLKGRLVTAGFNDAHIHFLSGSLGLSQVDLTGAETLAEVTTRIAEFAAKNPARPWITGRGWQYTMFQGGLPTHEVLDAITRDRPIFISAYDGHSAWVNSKALELAGINHEYAFKDFGEVVRDAKGEPTGALKEDAMSLVSKLIPQPTRSEKMDALRAGLKLAASLGITTLQNASGTPDEFAMYEELFTRGELTARVSTAFSVDEKTTPEDIKVFTQLKNRIGNHPMLRANAVKFMLDGVIESHTGAMLSPYSDALPGEPFPSGSLALPLDRYRELVNTFDQRGFQIYTHAIGDRAVREALNAYAAARKNNKSQSRHRIEHIETISREDMPRFAALGVMASMEPIHAEPGTVSVWSKAIGPERLPNSFAWASLLESHSPLVFSSDWPACVSLDPVRGLHTAVNRRTIDGMPAQGWVPAQKITIGDAMLAYTRAGSFSSGDENVRGMIVPGQVADLIVFSQDLFVIDPMKIHETRVVMTLLNGKIIYKDKALFR